MVVAGIACGIVANGAAMDWKVTGAASTSGYSVYIVLSSAVADTFENADAVSALALNGGSGTIVSTGRAYAANGSIDDASLSKGDALSIIFVNADKSQWAVTSIDNSKIYDPNNQETSPGALTFANTAVTGATYKDFGGGNVPEPTTGLLILLGIASLSLKRKIA